MRSEDLKCLPARSCVKFMAVVFPMVISSNNFGHPYVKTTLASSIYLIISRPQKDQIF